MGLAPTLCIRRDWILPLARLLLTDLRNKRSPGRERARKGSDLPPGLRRMTQRSNRAPFTYSEAMASRSRHSSNQDPRVHTTWSARSPCRTQPEGHLAEAEGAAVLGFSISPGRIIPGLTEGGQDLKVTEELLKTLKETPAHAATTATDCGVSWAWHKQAGKLARLRSRINAAVLGHCCTRTRNPLRELTG
jgi:hypothetical protein